MREALVEHHRDVGPELRLNVSGFFRREQMLGAVEMRFEARALLGDGAPIGEAEHLISTAVGENRSVPVHESVQSAGFFQQIQSINIGTTQTRAQYQFGMRSSNLTELRDYAPRMEVDAQTYAVRADGQLLTCEPATSLPMTQRYFLF